MIWDKKYKSISKIIIIILGPTLSLFYFAMRWVTSELRHDVGSESGLIEGAETRR